MPKIKQMETYKHPNSRKTKALVKQLKKQNVKHKNKLSATIKQNLLGEKILWFRDNFKDVTSEKCTAEEVEKVIEKYLHRFDEELEQIKLKHSIGNRRNRQHASREDIIGLTIKREREEFENAGIELPDVLNKSQFELLKNWSGELRFMQNFKLRRFSKNNLKTKPSTNDDDKTVSSSNEMEIV